MSVKSKYTFKKILVAVVWILLSSGTVVLLIAAITKRNNEHCNKVDINITGVQNNFFIDKTEVLNILQKTNAGIIESKPLHTINLALMETALQTSQWIKKAELFFDNNNVLQVHITEREPVARIFTSSGSSFYIDSSLAKLPLSDKFSARLPVFTNYSAGAIILSQEDSSLIKQVSILSEFIYSSPFWMAQIEQVDILPDHTFDLIPKLGNQVIHFGSIENYHEKFNNLLCFYKEVLTKKGWNIYSSIDAKFAGQVVGVRRGAGEIKSDSLRSVQIMKAIIAEAQKHTNDSGNVQLEQADDNNNIINTSIEKDIPGEDANDNIPTSGSLTPIHVPEKPALKIKNDAKKIVSNGYPPFVEKPNPIPQKKRVSKPAVTKPLKNAKEKPKAVMPSKTDY